MSGLDMLEDSFPHGTIEGHRLGCKGGICARNEIGDTCSQAAIRYAGDWEYRKAVDAGAPLPPMVHDRPRGSQRNVHTGAVIPAPTVKVAAAVVKPRSGRPRAESTSHPSYSGFQHGCRIPEECPSFQAGGRSCRDEGMAYKRDWARQKRANAKAAS